MQFKIDENLPLAVAKLLRSAGHDAVTVHDQQVVGISDPDLANVCRAETRALVTLDLDFSDIRTYPTADHSGIIVLRPVTQASVNVLALVSQLTSLLENERLDGCLWILQENSLRIREGN